MKLYNTLSRQVEVFKPLVPEKVRIYSCGPTVYDHIHIGNLSAFIAADTLRRVLQRTTHQKVNHVMNFTDVDDKTIRRSRERYPDMSPEEALATLTSEYSQIFLTDMQAIGNDTAALTFVKATDNIDGIRELIADLYKQGFAYITDDGVYFSIEKYKASGKVYGQLLELSSANTSTARIDNDEYDKESVHDFALWKTRKQDEPAWQFELDGHELLGRPGWHIECSVMSTLNLGQPFDIHTGGVDLIFPHHENEIAQSTAGQDNPQYAKIFVHNEHLLVDSKKMSKSLGNFFTLRDIEERGFDPLAFRLMVLQSHYRSQSNFSWLNLQAAGNRLQALRAFADLRWQPVAGGGDPVNSTDMDALGPLFEDDLNLAAALAVIAEVQDRAAQMLFNPESVTRLVDYLELLDAVLGLQLLATPNITTPQQQLLDERQTARDAKQWSQSDAIRNELSAQGIGVRDTMQGQIWFRI